MPDDSKNRTTSYQSAQEVQGNQQNISGGDIDGPVVSGNVGQIGDITTTTTSTTTHNYNLFPPLTRRQWISAGLAFLVLFLCLAVYATRTLWLPQPHCPANQTCLIIAAFGPANEPKAIEITTALEQELRQVLDAAGAADVAIVQVREVADSQAARAVAAEEGALLVIWGTVFPAEGKTRIYFELADRLGVGESGQIRPYRAEPLRYDPVAERIECTACIDIAGEVTRRTHVIAWFALGLARYAAGQPEAAQPNFLAALFCAGEEVDGALLPVRPDCTPSAAPDPSQTALIRYYLGKSFVLQGEYRQGIAALTAAAQANPNDPAAWIAIGEAYTNWYGDALPNPPAAQDAFTKAATAAHALSPVVFATQRAFALGLIYELQGDPAAAASAYAAVIAGFAADDPGAYVSLVALARAQTQADQRDEAEANLRKTTDLLLNAPWAYLALARLLADDRAAAEALIEQARAAAPTEAYIAITQAELCAGWGDRACAEEAYTAALALRPNSGWLYSRVGDFYLPTDPPVAGQSWEEAERHYRKAVELRPADPWVHQRLGYVLLNLQKNAEAAAEYETAIALLPDDLPPGELACTLALAQERAHLPVTAACP